jgi:hypothetical protein
MTAAAHMRAVDGRLGISIHYARSLGKPVRLVLSSLSENLSSPDALMQIDGLNQFE